MENEAEIKHVIDKTRTPIFCAVTTTEEKTFVGWAWRTVDGNLAIQPSATPEIDGIKIILTFENISFMSPDLPPERG